MEETRYNPDVLECIANLSNDEVFTPPAVANRMLDLLPNEIWSNKDARFLDPCAKSGVFLREIAKRLIEGLKEEMPDLQERVNHIFGQMLFALPITELTAQISRRTVYCSKDADSEYSVCRTFADNQGNIVYRNTEHDFDAKGRCRFCGASESVFGAEQRRGRESHAYEFIHTSNIEDLFGMKFDVIIGNPPYQLNDGSGGSSDSAIPIYNRFIEHAINLSPRYLVMIVPSKWMVGGRGLVQFRDKMKNDMRLKVIYDYEDAADCFPGVHIDGGACYFLWDNQYNGKTHHVYHTIDGDVIEFDHYLTNDYFDYVIRDSRILSILDKIEKVDSVSFSSIVSNVRPYGIRGYLFNEPERYPDSHLSENPFENSVKIYGVKGIKGGARRTEGYITRDTIKTNINSIDKYKLFFTTSYSTGAKNPPSPILGNPNTVCTETFLEIGPFENEEQMNNCLSFINTSFFKFLLYYGKGTMHVTSQVFSLIPLQDFSKSWSDAELYAKYGLSEEEVGFIEGMIREM